MSLIEKDERKIYESSVTKYVYKNIYLVWTH